MRDKASPPRPGHGGDAWPCQPHHGPAAHSVLQLPPPKSHGDTPSFMVAPKKGLVMWWRPTDGSSSLPMRQRGLRQAGEEWEGSSAAWHMLVTWCHIASHGQRGDEDKVVLTLCYQVSTFGRREKMKGSVVEGSRGEAAELPKPRGGWWARWGPAQCHRSQLHNPNPLKPNHPANWAAALEHFQASKPMRRRCPEQELPHYCVFPLHWGKASWKLTVYFSFENISSADDLTSPLERQFEESSSCSTKKRISGVDFYQLPNKIKVLQPDHIYCSISADVKRQKGNNCTPTNTHISTIVLRGLGSPTQHSLQQIFHFLGPSAVTRTATIKQSLQHGKRWPLSPP